MRICLVVLHAVLAVTPSSSFKPLPRCAMDPDGSALSSASDTSQGGSV